MDRYPDTVEFQSRERVSDGMGGETYGDWTTFFTTEANVQPISGYTRIVAQQQESPITTKIFFPFTETVIKPSTQAIHGNKTYTVKSDPIDQGGRGRILMVECNE